MRRSTLLFDSSWRVTKRFRTFPKNSFEDFFFCLLIFTKVLSFFLLPFPLFSFTKILMVTKAEMPGCLQWNSHTAMGRHIPPPSPLDPYHLFINLKPIKEKFFFSYLLLNIKYFLGLDLLQEKELKKEFLLEGNKLNIKPINFFFP